LSELEPYTGCSALKKEEKDIELAINKYVSAGHYVTLHLANYGYKNGHVLGLTKKHRDLSLPFLERYKGVSKIFRTDAVKIINPTTKRPPSHVQLGTLTH
jgi:hypothetical protein